MTALASLPRRVFFQNLQEMVTPIMFGATRCPARNRRSGFQTRCISRWKTKIRCRARRLRSGLKQAPTNVLSHVKPGGEREGWCPPSETSWTSKSRFPNRFVTESRESFNKSSRTVRFLLTERVAESIVLEKLIESRQTFFSKPEVMFRSF